MNFLNTLRILLCGFVLSQAGITLSHADQKKILIDIAQANPHLLALSSQQTLNCLTHMNRLQGKTEKEIETSRLECMEELTFSKAKYHCKNAGLESPLANSFRVRKVSEDFEEIQSSDEEGLSPFKNFYAVSFVRRSPSGGFEFHRTNGWGSVGTPGIPTYLDGTPTGDPNADFLTLYQWIDSGEKDEDGFFALPHRFFTRLICVGEESKLTEFYRKSPARRMVYSESAEMSSYVGSAIRLGKFSLVGEALRAVLEDPKAIFPFRRTFRGVTENPVTLFQEEAERKFLENYRNTLPGNTSSDTSFEDQLALKEYARIKQIVHRR